jgi:Na+(H+)/acetate symporter ActP
LLIDVVGLTHLFLQQLFSVDVDLTYRYGFWDGASIPIGLGISLILNGLLLAHHVNNDEVLTLPDVFAKRYGRVVEILVSLCTIISFIMLLAGNLLGQGVICAYVWGISETVSIWIAGFTVWSYTITGGLFSVAYVDVVQGTILLCLSVPTLLDATSRQLLQSESVSPILSSHPTYTRLYWMVRLYRIGILAHSQLSKCARAFRWLPGLHLSGRI